jgi:glutaredoxin
MQDNIKPYLIVIYGKEGCPKCVKLKQQINAMLADDNVSKDFDMDYQNLSTAEGMAAYALSETVNGQRIPAVQIMNYSSGDEAYIKIPDTRKECFDEEGKLFVPVYLQAQTHYDENNGEISETNIAELIALARGQ